MRRRFLIALGLVLALASPALARFLAGGMPGGAPPPPPPQVIGALTTSQGAGACSFPSGVQNGVVCTISVAMIQPQPPFSGSINLCTGTNLGVGGASVPGCSGINSGGFRLAGGGCSGVTTCTLQQSSGSSGTAAGTYTDVTVYAAQTGVPNSPQFLPLSLTGAAVTGTLTTSTWQNDGAVAAQPGQLVTIGQAWARGDIPAGMHPVLRDAASHVVIPVQQLDYISYRNRNGDDGSWLQSVAQFQLPPTSPQYTGGTIPGANGDDSVRCVNLSCFQVEYVLAPGAYSSTGKQTLAGLCAVYPQFNIHLTDVRNGFDDTLRDSGEARFYICNNINNPAGSRDAPLHYVAGPGVDGYEIRGMFEYQSGGAPNGHKDPLLYPICDIDLTTSPTDQTSLGDIRWTCTIHNGFMNVAAGSSGNTGNPGPVGMLHDPQGVTYRPTVENGPTNWLNYNQYDASVPSSAFKTSGCQGNYPGCVTIPGSVGINMWYTAMAERFTTSGTAPAGLTNGQLTFMTASGGWFNACVGPFTAEMAFSTGQNWLSPPLTLTSIGSATQNLSFRVYHTRFMSWYTLDPSGWENWIPAGTNTRVTRPWRPALSKTERDYWVRTGLVAPFITTASSTVFTNCNDHPQNRSYAPMGWGITIGGTGGGDRPDLSWPNDWMAAAFLNETSSYWNQARWFDLSQGGYDLSDVINEATGHIPVLNDGPPSGPGGGGGGGSYPILGAPTPNVGLSGNLNVGFIDSTDGGSAGGGSGSWGFRDGPDHVPGFTDLLFLMFGQQYQLDAIHQWFNRTMFTRYPGPNIMAAPSCDCRDIVLPNGNHFYDVFSIGSNQRRGSFRIAKEVYRAAISGPDTWPDGTTNAEKTMALDILTENKSLYDQWEAAIDGSSTNFRNAVISPATDGINGADPFMDDYGIHAYYEGYAAIRDPLAAKFLPKWANFYNDACGANSSTHPLLLEYCSPETYSAGVHDHDHVFGLPNTGQYYTSTAHDASDFGIWDNYVEIAANGQITQNNGIIEPVHAGDLVKNIQPHATGTLTGTILDQMPGNQFFEVMNVGNDANGSFFVKNPATGTPFTGFTSGGNPVVVNTTGSWAFQFRPVISNGPLGFVHQTYAVDLAGMSAVLNVVKSLTGIDMLPFYNAVVTRGDGQTGPAAGCAKNCYRNQMDPNAVVP